LLYIIEKANWMVGYVGTWYANETVYTLCPYADTYK